MGVARAFWRGLRVVEHLLSGALISMVVSLATRLGHRPVWAPRVVRWWHERLHRALGVLVRVSGRVQPGCLLVANHVSWLDVPVLGAQAQIGFLSKAEVRDWPLVGWMSAVAGTLFIQRGANQTGEIADRIGEGLALGRTLAIFPEGTTTDGREVRRFHPRLFAIAQQPGLGIQPVAIAYRRGEDLGPDPSVAFVGEDTLIANLLRVIRHPNLVAELSLLPPIYPAQGEDRRAIANRTRVAIVEALGLPAQTLPQGTGAARRPALEDSTQGKDTEGLGPLDPALSGSG
jgi:1-acyl-sn-glycerol-3-phosphate acyltransferase